MSDPAGQEVFEAGHTAAEGIKRSELIAGSSA